MSGTLFCLLVAKNVNICFNFCICSAQIWWKAQSFSLFFVYQALEYKSSLRQLVVVYAKYREKKL